MTHTRKFHVESHDVNGHTKIHIVKEGIHTLLIVIQHSSQYDTYQSINIVYAQTWIMHEHTNKPNWIGPVNALINAIDNFDSTEHIVSDYTFNNAHYVDIRNVWRELSLMRYVYDQCSASEKSTIDELVELEQEYYHEDYPLVNEGLPLRQAFMLMQDNFHDDIEAAELDVDCLIAILTR